MKVGMVASHYLHAAYREEFISRVHQVRERESRPREIVRLAEC